MIFGRRYHVTVLEALQESMQVPLGVGQGRISRLL